MNKQFFKQFAIALILFLLGYFTFNSKLFAAEMPIQSTSQLTVLSAAFSPRFSDNL
ncbi:hypothetical protein [Undibacterium parvum]|uniref:hypothetical protein n=1 Tax=Undibacterium parvum TaxID=401471 RepID=UPI0014768124|nr:hypothetical protein [Undibacterium parvum]